VSTDDRRRAVHEAGHAVVARALGWTLRLVTIEATTRDDGGEASGVCEVESPEGYELSSHRWGGTRWVERSDDELDREIDRRRACAHAVICSAGLAAEQLVFCGQVSPWDITTSDGHCGHDLNVAVIWAGYVPGRPLSPAVLKRAQAVYMRAARLLNTKPSARAMKALVPELLARRTIDGTAALAIIAKAEP
jgi:hypothetical protein